MAGLEGGLNRLLDELNDLREKRKNHKKELLEKDQQLEKLEGELLEKDQRFQKLEGEAKALEDKCLAQEKTNEGLRAEVEQLKAELEAGLITLEGKEGVIEGLEGKLGEAQRSNKTLTQEVGRLRDDYQLAQLKLAEARKQNKRADAKAVAAYKKSPAFHDDAADLFGGEMEKLLGVFAEELKLRAPDVNPRDFIILKSLFEEGEEEAGEGPQVEGEGPKGEGKGPQGEAQGEGPQTGGQGEGQGEGPQTGGQGEGQDGGGAEAEGDHGEAGAGDGIQA